MRYLVHTILAAVLLSTAAGAADAALVLRATAEVSGDMVCLADIADVSGAAGRVEIGRAPAPGQNRRFTAAAVRLALRRAGLGAQEVTGEAVAVFRRSQEITADELAAVAQAALRAQLTGWPRCELQPVSGLPLTLTLPDAALNITAEAAELSSSGRTTVNLTLWQDGRVTKRLATVWDVTCYGSVLVADRAIVTGETIDPTAVHSEERAMTRQQGCPLTDTAALANSRATRLIRPGMVLSAAMLEPVPVILRGDEAEITVLRGGVNITIRARAREEGLMGDTIRFTNPDNNRIFTAEVTGPAAAVIR